MNICEVKSDLEKLTFEFAASSNGVRSLFSGAITSVNWDLKSALVDITPDGVSYWSELFDSPPTSVIVSLNNLICNTEKVSSMSYSQLLDLVKLHYPLLY
jgi:hypothetical protein